MHGVFLLPGRSLHLLETGAHDDLDFRAAQAAGGAAAIHRGVAAAEHDDALADLLDVAERNVGEPLDADVDVLGRFLAPGNVELAPARRAGTDEDRVVVFGEQLLQAVDAVAALELDAEVEDVVGFLVDHGVGQAEFRDLAPHHAARFRVGIEHGAVIAERHEIARHRKRGGTAADQRNALAVLRPGFRHAVLDVVLEVGGDALEAADRDGIFLDAAAATSRLARAVAGASQDSRKHVRLPIDHVGVAVAALGDQADVFRNGGVRGTGPLAIDHLVEVVGRRNVGRFHSSLVRAVSRTARPCIALNAYGAFFSFLNWIIGLPY